MRQEHLDDLWIGEVVGVVPKFAAFFGRRGVPLPWTTQALLDLSAWMRTYGIWLAAGLVVALGTAFEPTVLT